MCSPRPGRLSRVTELTPSMRVERYILRSFVNRERTTTEELGRYGITAVSPRTREFKRVSRNRIVAINKVAYPGYIFAEMRQDQWGKLREMPQAPRPLMLDGRPYALRQADVELVDSMIANPPVDPLDPYKGKDPIASPFFKGQKVTILSGPFASFKATVERVKKRVRVVVDLFGRPTPIDIEAIALAPA